MIGMQQYQSTRLTQRLTLIQKLALSLEQVLKILQEIRLELGLTQAQTIRLVAEITLAAEQYSVYTTAYGIVHEEGATAGYLLCDVLKLMVRHVPEWSVQRETLTNLAVALRIHADRHKSHHAHPALVLKIAMRAPDFFGGRDGNPGNLAEILQFIDQIDEFGRPRWALAGGWAVEMLTGVSRSHHDIDAVLLGKNPERIDTDCVSPENYFNVLSCSNRFLTSRCLDIVEWSWADIQFKVVVLRPEFLFCSKFVRSPREKDLADVVALVEKFADEWDLTLIDTLMRKNNCGFDKAQQSRLRRILAEDNVGDIIAAIRIFWS